MAGGDDLRAGAADPHPALAPPWTTPVGLAALAVGSLLAALVWHATRLDAIDAWVMHRQQLAYSHAHRIAADVSRFVLPAVTLMVMAAGALLAWRARRRDAAALALIAAPATLAADKMLKPVVHRQWNGDPDLLFPSGHVAVAIATAMTAVLVLRVVPRTRPARKAAALVGGGVVLVVLLARLAETVHSLTDVLGGGATGLVVTLGAASAITALSRRAHVRAGSSSGVSVDLVEIDEDGPVAGAGQSRS